MPAPARVVQVSLSEYPDFEQALVEADAGALVTLDVAGARLVWDEFSGHCFTLLDTVKSYRFE